MNKLTLLALGLLLGGAPAIGAEDPAMASEAGVAFFETHIRPVLVERCYRCHGAAAERPKAGLRLDSREGVLRGGDSGPAVVPGQPEESLLIEAIRSSDASLQMPPQQRLTPEQVARFEEWVRMGAPDPRAPDAETPGVAAAIDRDAMRRPWSFRPVIDPPVPSVADEDWPRNDIDRFILARLEESGLRPAPLADKRTLIRRVTFDLTGLPPTPEEVEAFLADESPEAFAWVADRLLASPHYGERWGRHWLDLARYADTSGCNSDFPVPSAYRYRNYVIDAFNHDKPYDQFLREQVAGDLLPARDEAQWREQTIATGYLAIARRFGSRAAEVHLTIEDTIDNLGKVVLGLSISCARCHDHKFDPIPQRDYYALYGIFASTRYAFPGTEIYPHTKGFVALGPPEEAEALRAFETRVAELDDRIERLVQEKARAAQEGQEPALGQRTLIAVKADLEDARTELRRLMNRPPDVAKAYGVGEGTPRDARIHRKGDPKQEGEEVRRGCPPALGGRALPAEATSSGRSELAHWLTDPAHPLVARVLVNRIWQHHFGRGIVPTPSDFGTRGAPPTHPELLDYLATRFVAGGWSIKAMHRLIVLSRTYQLAGVDDPRHAALDPGNDLRGRFDRRRLSAEEIRDALLAVAGTLDPTRGEAHPFPPEPEWQYTQHRPFLAVYETNRRSVYLMQQRIKKHPFLGVFDGADPNVTTADRPLTTTAPQALLLMNDPFVHEQADHFAVRVGLAFTEEAERIDSAHRLAFGRPATEEEIRNGREYLRDCRARLEEAGVPWDRRTRAALASYARVLLSSNEFLFVD